MPLKSLVGDSARRIGSAPFRIALLYAVIGFAWVAIGDVGLLRTGEPDDMWDIGLIKGLVFVGLTSTVLYLLVRREVARRQKVAAQLEAVLDAAPLGIAHVDSGGRITRWNAAAAETLQVPASTAGGRAPADIGLSLPPASARVADVTAQRADGVTLPIRLYRRPAVDGDGEIIVFFDRTQDIDVENAQRQLQKLQAIGRLAGGVAHDFNNLLTAVLGHAVLLADALPADEALHDHVEEIRRAALRGAGVTRQLLVVSGRSVARPQLLRVGDVIRELYPVLARAAGDAVQIDLRLASDTWSVQCDAGQLEQVLLNLIVNAREAMPGGGVIAIATDTVQTGLNEPDGVPPGQFVRVAVSDTGRGMDAETQLHLFEPFFTTKQQGTGLGLATVYGVMQQYHGYVRVRSESGSGSEFELLFPRAEPAPRSEPLAGPVPVGDAATLLVVEDDDLVRDLTCRLLRRGGHQVLAARDATEALDIASRRPDIDLVVADIIMPGMNGIDLSRRLREQHPDLPILLTSGYTAGALLDEGELDRETQFLAKPFRPEELLARVRQLLTRGRTHA